MSKQTHTELDELRSELEQARAAAEAAQAKVDDLIVEQTELPSGQQAALLDGDGVAYAILCQRERELPAARYFAQVQQLKARLAVYEAEAALLDAELKPLKAEYDAADAAVAEALKRRGRPGAEIQNRLSRKRMIAGQKQTLTAKLEQVQADYLYQQRVAGAPVVRSLPHAPRLVAQH